MSAIAIVIVSALAAPAPPPDNKVIISFTNGSKTTYKWFEQNDPVMGGRSHGNFSLVQCSCGETYARFQGAVEIVPSLKAPGFCRAFTVPFLENIGDFVDGSLQLTVRTPSTFNTTGYSGFKVAFSAIGVPTHHGGHEASGMYKAPLKIPPSSFPEAWVFVDIPFKDFSWDWSDFTGECTTKDPDGYQHKCCSDDDKYCPTKSQLKKVDGVSIWAEGVAGEFLLEMRDFAVQMPSKVSV